jgi:hypothetical protein
VNSRKGSMQLSIEAIIILVIAIVLLGLGIAFIKGFFGKGSDALLGKFEPLKEECDVNSNNPIIPKEYHVKKGEVTAASICVFNDQDSDVVNGEFKVDGCIGPGVTTPSATLININSLGQTLPRGKSAGYKTTVTTDSSVQVGATYICNIRVLGTGASPKSVGPVQMTFQVS